MLNLNCYGLPFNRISFLLAPTESLARHSQNAKPCDQLGNEIERRLVLKLQEACVQEAPNA